MQTLSVLTSLPHLRPVPPLPFEAPPVRRDRPSGICPAQALAGQPANEPWPDAAPGTFDSEPPPSQLRPAIRDGAAEDAALVRAARAGDFRAHVAIWRKYTALVRSKIARSIGRDDAEDHVQEVFLRLFEYLSELRDPTALRSFIIGITLRVAGTELRRRSRRGWLTLTATGELPDPPARWTNDEGDTREVLGALLAILNKLTPHTSRVFELRYIEDRELADVAKTMNISLATAKRHLARASACVFASAESQPALAGFLRSRSRAKAAAIGAAI